MVILGSFFSRSWVTYSRGPRRTGTGKEASERLVGSTVFKTDEGF